MTRGRGETPPTSYRSLAAVREAVIACERCPRLRAYCREVAARRRAAFATEEYWGLPVPGWGDPQAALCIVGLAPAAHGANRTGRMFTGDRSGDFLYAALHRAGFASAAASRNRHDGLTLRRVYITAAVRCAPPENRPLPDEFAKCRPYLAAELDLLSRWRVLLALGRLAHDQAVTVIRERGELLAEPGGRAPRPGFAHGAAHALAEGRLLLDCYHPSQQNTFTGRLTPAMLDAVLAQARATIAGVGRRRQRLS